MRYPEKLNKGDTIGIICPSSPVDEGKTPALIKKMEELGYKVKAADNLEENYGLVLNHDRYYIIYDSFSSNLPPTVEVLEKG